MSLELSEEEFFNHDDDHFDNEGFQNIMDESDVYKYNKQDILLMIRELSKKDQNWILEQLMSK